MRAILLSSAIAVGATLLTPAAGQAQTYPWCAQYGMWGGGGRNCGFVSYGQCMATVRGIGGYCERNSFYAGPEGYYGRRHKKPVRRDY